MGRRKDADRAEAIVKGVGTIFLLLLLLGITQVLPGMLKGQSSGEMINTMLHIVMVFVFLCMLVAGIGLIVWVVVKRK
jgi:hypothetical protein